MGKKRTFKFDGEVYDVPEQDVEGFLSRKPKAVEVESFVVGKDTFDVLRAACINPIIHYSLPVGQLREGDGADFILVKDLENFEVQATYVRGQKVAENGKSLIPRIKNEVINKFKKASVT